MVAKNITYFTIFSRETFWTRAFIFIWFGVSADAIILAWKVAATVV